MATDQEPWFLKSTFPVLFPTHSALALPPDKFDAFLKEELAERHREQDVEAPRDVQASQKVTETNADDSFTLVSAGQSTTAELRDIMREMGVDEEYSVGMSPPKNTEDVADTDAKKDNENKETPAHPFMKGLVEHDSSDPKPQDMENKMFTENMDLAHRSTKNPLVDLFMSLEQTISGPHLLELLNAAWKEDALLTLKIIFNARSIHLGKSERATFYRCAGWLAQNHPLTLVSNLRWLSRPVIEKKVEKKGEGEEDAVLVEAEKDEDDVSRFDVKNGVSHGYWKDLVNILALSANGLLTVLAQPAEILNIERGVGSKRGGPQPANKKELAKAKRHAVRDERHQKATELFDSDPVHRALHITIARLFAEQLRSDLTLLRGDDAKAKKRISLCAKWAPSHDRFHDKHTFVVSTIAEILHPMVGEMDRELYLRHARESYRKDMSSLRQHLDIVERNLAAKTLDKIKYDRVPSIAMQNYAPIFEKKDPERFNEYVKKVGEGTVKISGATLLPSTLIRDARDFTNHTNLKKMVANAQWKALVQRIKDNGTMESSIAICDVSGSMASPRFPDGTCPMDSAIGLSLLVAEVTAPPFGGSFITFSEKPQVQTLDLAAPLGDKVRALAGSHWGMSTNFVSVFEDLILPMAVENKLKPEDMVKRIFVFSDMQFNQADRSGSGRWTTSFERIKKKFADAGYEVPQMVFWNLAGGRAGYAGPGSAPGGGTYLGFDDAGDPVPPKPVTVEDHNTAVVSGYSQGMLKVFLQNGSFEDLEEVEEEETEEEGKTVEQEGKETSDAAAGSEENAEKEGVPQAKKRKIDPLSTVKKAVRHKAYDMLMVVD